MARPFEPEAKARGPPFVGEAPERLSLAVQAKKQFDYTT
jgi:hypothetical protein